MLHYTYTSTGQKISQQLEDDGRLGTRLEYAGPFVYVNSTLGWINTTYGRIVALPRGGFHKELHLRDHLGNTRMALEEIDSKYEVVQEAAYYPFGMAIPSQSFALPNENDTYQNRYLYNGKEYQDDFKLNWYDYGARFYDPQIGRFHSVDRFTEEFNNWSPYHYANNNPISNIDFNGDSTVVVTGANNTYEVRGGSPTDSKGLYLLNDNGEVTLIGQTLTPYSFFDDDNNAVVGAIIDPNSSEGTDFLGELITDNPGLVEYMINARSGEDYKYDFKERGLSKSEQTPQQHRYRGSKMVDGVYGSARDFGNMGAGMVASRKGLSWFMARVGFDAYDSYKSGNIGVEGRPSQAAQRLGFIIGISLRKTDKE